jgi:SAM-dependent methyltransferase
MPGLIRDCDFLLPEVEAIRNVLARRYSGVFTDSAMESHLINHVGSPVADWAVGTLDVCGLWSAGTRILDIGAGFGSFVVQALRRGWNAVGLELDPFDVEMGRLRLGRLFPGRDSADLLRLGDGRALPYSDQSFDVVTLWNVLEHVSDLVSLLKEVRRVLVPGGSAYMVCPNYAASRLEAHYHIPMEGEEAREDVVRRLREAGRDPAFFESSIFYRTNQEVLSTLSQLDFKVYDLHNVRCMDRTLWTLWRRLRHPDEFRSFYDPRKESVMLTARTRR